MRLYFSRAPIGSTIASREDVRPGNFHRMPLNNESLSASRQEFCLALKAARERKGITLDQIASATKIPAYLFASLERSDLRRWPKGLFRRSFFRDYARTIGVPDDLCAEFVRLFPDDVRAEAATKTAASVNEAGQEGDLRLSLDPEWHGPRASLLLRLLGASIDAAIVILISCAFAWLADVDRPSAIAIFALAYFTFATAIFGESPSKWVIARRAAIASAFTSAGEEPAPEAADDPETRAWMSDAHRVGPSRLRVRIKVS